MLSLGTVQENKTDVTFFFSTAAADGGEESFSATLEEADIIIYKDGTALTLAANTINGGSAISAIATGLYKIPIDLSNDADFTTGSDYWVTLDASDETIDSQAVSAVLGHFRIESDDEQAVRLFRQYLYPTGATISATGGGGWQHEIPDRPYGYCRFNYRQTGWGAFGGT